MSEEEIREQKAYLLLELDDQKIMVASLRERDTRDHEAMQALADSYLPPNPSPELRGSALRIGNKDYPLSSFDVVAGLERRKSLAAAEEKLRMLVERAQKIGIQLS